MIDFIAADSGIRQLQARFVDAIWRKDSIAISECFCLQGAWKIAGKHWRGRAEIGETIGKLLTAYANVWAMLGIPLLEIEENTATGRISVTELAKLPDGGAHAAWYLLRPTPKSTGAGASNCAIGHRIIVARSISPLHS